MKRSIAFLLLAVLTLSMLTGCVSSNTATAPDVNRPAVSVMVGDAELIPTPEAEEPAAAPTSSEEGVDGVPLDSNIYNPVNAGDVITMGAKTGSAKSVCYRINSGDPVVVTGAAAEVTVSADLDKLEMYIIASNGIASNWVTYFFEVA